eukprot:191737_1
MGILFSTNTTNTEEEIQTKTWKISIADGVGNSYDLKWPEQPNFFYRGLRPIESSSGSYDGRPDVEYNAKTEKEASGWRKATLDVINDSSNVSESRPKGMWIVRMDKKSIFINKGTKFNQLKKMLSNIKSKGRKLEIKNDGGLFGD